MFRICRSIEAVLQPGQPFTYSPSPLLRAQNGQIRVTVRSTERQGDLHWRLLGLPDGTDDTQLFAQGLVEPVGYYSEIIDELPIGDYLIQLNCSPPGNVNCSGLGRIENV